MNNTIPFHSAPHAPQITVDVNILTMLKQAASCLTEAAGRDVYLAAIGPDMELTIIMEEDAPSVLPCFDEDDALITVKGAPLFISYNPAQVLKLAGKRYLTGPVIFYRTDGHSTIVSLTVEDEKQSDRYFSEFIKLCATFVALFKSQGHKIDDLGSLQDNGVSSQKPFFRKRNAAFKMIVRPLMEAYDAFLREKGAVDFADMHHTYF